MKIIEKFQRLQQISNDKKAVIAAAFLFMFRELRRQSDVKLN